MKPTAPGTDRHHPVAIIEDRYTGVYSGGRWLAISEADLLHGKEARVGYVINAGPSGDDGDAMDFWSDPPEWIAIGASPQEALENLLRDVRAQPFTMRSPPRSKR